MYPIVYRKVISPIWQLCKGQKINCYLHEFANTNSFSRKQLELLQLEKLKKLIDYCELNIPYYRELFKNTGITASEITSFKDYEKIPVLTKNEVRNHYQEFLPDTNLKIKYSNTQTSGSTGMSTQFRVSKTSGERWYASKLYNRTLHGVKPGDPILWIWGRRNSLQVSKFSRFIKERIENEYRISAFDISEENTDKIIKVIKKRKIKAIYAYSSALYEFSILLKQRNLVLPLQKIFVTSEKLLEHQKQLIEEVFACKAISEYGAAEMGILAFECVANQYHIIEENVYLEAIESTDNSYKQIVVTDLHNYAMPLLRYQSGDLTSGIYENKCACGSAHKILSDVVGRQYDMIRLKNNKTIHGEMINYLVKEVTLSKSACGFMHQFIQYSHDDFTLFLVAPELRNEEKEMIKDSFTRGFAEYLGNDYPFNLTVVFTDKIERPENGKHRFIISKIHS